MPAVCEDSAPEPASAQRRTAPSRTNFASASWSADGTGSSTGVPVQVRQGATRDAFALAPATMSATISADWIAAGRSATVMISATGRPLPDYFSDLLEDAFLAGALGSAL